MLVVCPYPEHMVPGQRLKYEQYFDYFRENGIDVTVKPFMSKQFLDIVYKKGKIAPKIGWTILGYIKRFALLFSARNYDITYVFLWITPFGFPVFEWLYRKCSRRLIYDIDDLVYLPESVSKSNKLVGFLKGRRKPIYLMKTADHVITCTPFLDQFVRQFNQHTTDISSTINTDKYKPRQSYQLRSGKIVLGWSGSHSTSKYVHLLEPVFRKLQEMGISFRVIVMGDENFSIPGIEIEAIPWKESYEVDVINTFDIGLYPLPDEQWVYGKSGLKALQYMAAGIPTLATAIGTNFRIMEDGVNGFLVKTTDEWVARIRELSADESLREKIGKNAAAWVEANYSVNANKDTYLTILRNQLTPAGSR